MLFGEIDFATYQSRRVLFSGHLLPCFPRQYLELKVTARCAFFLNNQPVSTLRCDGKLYAAFSGEKGYENNPADTSIPKEGPLPTGTYYIVDRQSGGHLGWFWDSLATIFNNSHRENWFALYRADKTISDYTFVNGVKRGNFRLHPVGNRGISEGCITLTSPQEFQKLRDYLKSQPVAVIPGTKIRYYGAVDVL